MRKSAGVSASSGTMTASSVFQEGPSSELSEPAASAGRAILKILLASGLHEVRDVGIEGGLLRRIFEEDYSCLRIVQYGYCSHFLKKLKVSKILSQEIQGEKMY